MKEFVFPSSHACPHQLPKGCVQEAPVSPIQLECEGVSVCVCVCVCALAYAQGDQSVHKTEHSIVYFCNVHNLCVGLTRE